MTGRILVGKNTPIKVKEKTIGELIFKTADIHRNKICQIDFNTGEEETFQSVKLRSIRVALELKKRGVTAHDVIAICSKNIMDNCIPVIASTFLGAAFTTLDPDLPVRDVRHLLNLVKAKFVFVDDASLDLVEKSLLEENSQLETQIVVFEESTKYLNFSEFVQQSKDEEDVFQPTIVESNQMAAILFTSGTTALPKGIRLSHLNFFHHLNDLVNYDENSLNLSMLHFTTLTWISAVLLLLISFSTGSKRILLKDFEPEKTFEIIEKYKVVITMASPSIAIRLINYERVHEFDTSSLILFYIGGGSISPAAVKKLEGIFPNAFVNSTYGTTECGVITLFVNTPEDVKLNKEKITSCGKVGARNMVKVVDLETEEILGPNQKGEIRCKSPGLMLGYVGVELNQVLDKDGFYKTGDVGYYDNDDCFFIVDRIKEMFIYLSMHIVPTCIEFILLEHPAVADCCVFGVPVAECEDDGEYPGACVVLKPNHTATTIDEIIKFVDERVIDRERLRGGVRIVDSILKTPTGKTKRRAIRDEFIKTTNKLC